MLRAVTTGLGHCSSRTIIRLGEIDAGALTAIRQRAIKEMADYVMGSVKAYFGK